MAFFKFRWPGQGEQQQAEKPSKRGARTPQAESIEVMRRRARHRLIGAAVLVLVGVIGFPLLFDTQPRPVPVDIPIEIPDRNKVAPLVVPAPVAEAPVAKPATPAAPPVAAPAAQRASAPRSAAANGLTEGEELVQSPRPSAAKPAPAAPTVAAAAPAAAPKPDTKPPVAPAPAPEPKPAQRPDDSARARALLEGRSAESAASANAEESRFIVQVGAFADAEKAREARTKVERAGLKTYTQVVDTKDGKRTRVRVGPFNNRAEADKAAARIKALELSASVLTL